MLIGPIVTETFIYKYYKYLNLEVSWWSKSFILQELSSTMKLDRILLLRVLVLVIV